MAQSSVAEFWTTAAVSTDPPEAIDADLGFEISDQAFRFVSNAAEARDLADELLPAAAEAISLSASLCPDCLAERAYDRMVVPMALFEVAGEVHLRKRCEEHGTQEDVCWTDAGLYHRARTLDEASRHPAFGNVPDGVVPDDPVLADDARSVGNVRPAEDACGTDSGGCCTGSTGETSGIGNITVTNRCDRSCHYCFFYAESGESLYEPTKAEIREMAARLAEEGVGAIQLTGGEPTVRGDIVEIVAIAAEHADQVLLNTHGARFAAEPDLARKVGAAGARGIYTSFDGLTPQHNPKNYWEFPRTLMACRDAGMCAMLVPTVVGGWNDEDLGDIVRFGAANAETVCGVNFQPVSFVGRMGSKERREQRVTVPDVIGRIAADTDGTIPADAWYPLPVYRAIAEFLSNWTGNGLYGLSSSFSSWMVTYVLVDGEELVPITDVIDIGELLGTLREVVTEYGGEPSGLDRARVAKELLADLDTLLGPEAPAAAEFGSGLRAVLADGRFDGLFDRLTECYDRVLPVGVRHFQDPYNYDLSRVDDCDVHYSMPDGRVVPFSVYNVVPERYRDRVKREHAISVAQWRDREYTALTRADAPNRTRRDGDVIDPDGGSDGNEPDEGIYGVDVTYRREGDEQERGKIEEAYRASIEDLAPVRSVL